MNTQKAKSDRIWLGIANVQPKPQSDFAFGGAGAHVAVFGYAGDSDEFLQAATRLLDALDFNVVEIDEIERLTISEFKDRVAAETLEIVECLTPETPVGYGTFYTYPGPIKGDGSE